MDAFAALVDRAPATDTFVIAADADDAQKLSKARMALARAQNKEQAAHTVEAKSEAAGAVDDAQAAYDERKATVATLTFHLRGIGPHLVEELIEAHPATKDQKAKARKANGGKPGNNWNDDTFPPALLAQSVVKIVHSDPDIDDATDIDLARVTAIWKSKISIPDKSNLFLIALGLDQRASGVGDLGND